MALLSLVILLLPDSVMRVILGLPLLLFFPGYTLIAALFPKKSDLDGIERVTLSFGLSIAVVPLLGLALNYTPWGIRLYPVLITVIAFILAMCIVTWLRRRSLPPDERFAISFEFNMAGWKGSSKLDRTLTLVLALAILAAVGTLIYVISTPKVGEKFTEFYILGPGKMAYDYPTKVSAGNVSTVIVGVVNHEYSIVNYTMEMNLDNYTFIEKGMTLEHNETWERPVRYRINRIGNGQKLQFLLYKEENFTAPYRDLHLWVNVSERSATGA